MINTLIAQSGKITNPFAPNLSPSSTSVGTDKLTQIIQTAVFALFIFGAIIFAFQFIIGGIKWMTSGGDKNSLQAARDQISHAIIGLVVLFTFYAVVKLIENFLNICIINIDLASLAGFGTGTSCSPNSGGSTSITPGNRDQWYLTTPSPSTGGSGRFGKD